MLSESCSDAEIIRASLSDPSRFEEIYARHHVTIYGFVARRIGVQDAGDLAADVFIRAFSIRHRYDTSKPNSLPWLYGIAVNLIGDRLRRNRRRHGQYPDSLAPAVIDPSSDADRRIAAIHVAGRLNMALGKLSSKDRETLLLYALEGLTYAEIGQVLGIPAGTVGSRITRARRRILELIPDLEQKTSEVPPYFEDGT